MITSNALLITAAISLLMSLALAWLASFILYAKIKRLKAIFPATHQLIRAHIDYLLMMLLLIACFYLDQRLNLSLPEGVIVLTCIGALYNPLGFIVLAIKPALANPETPAQTLRVLLGFLPATLGYGYVMLSVLYHFM